MRTRRTSRRLTPSHRVDSSRPASQCKYRLHPSSFKATNVRFLVFTFPIRRHRYGEFFLCGESKAHNIARRKVRERKEKKVPWHQLFAMRLRARRAARRRALCAVAMSSLSLIVNYANVINYLVHIREGVDEAFAKIWKVEEWKLARSFKNLKALRTREMRIKWTEYQSHPMINIQVTRHNNRSFQQSKSRQPASLTRKENFPIRQSHFERKISIFMASSQHNCAISAKRRLEIAQSRLPK